LEEKTKQRIKEEIEKHFDTVFLRSEETAVVEKGFRAGTLVGDLHDALKNYGAIGVWREIESALSARPEPTTEKLDELLANVPQLVYMLRDQALALRKALPHRPGGAPSKLTAEEKKKAVRLVGTLMGQGDNYSEAVAKIAERFGVSTKTIQRAWQKAHAKKGGTGESK